MINAKVTNYVNSVVDYIKTNYSNKINKIVVYGEAVNEEIAVPSSIDFGINLVNASDVNDFEMLGDILSYVGDIVTDMDCSVLPISDKIVQSNTEANMNKGEIVYEANI